ncbi:hypothetical protein HDV00_002058 [Rhizophlyctis rosea]|nr:hypothetical protein HDV00_002058 [Rhizophlyctis rosea]
MFDAHYKAIKVVKFTADDTVFVTAGEDAAVNVWILSTTLKIFSTLSGTLLSTILFPKPLTSLVIDPIETVAYAGATDGGIYVVKLYSVGEGGEVAGLRGGVVESAEERGTCWRGHVGRVECLQLGFDAGVLVSGGEDGVVGVWDCGSGVRVRTFEGHKAPITSAHIILRPPYLLDASSFYTTPAFAPFKRYQTSLSDTSSPSSGLPPPIPIQSFPTLPTSSEPEVKRSKKGDMETKIESLIAENRKLEQRNGMLRRMNDELYGAVLDGVVGGGKEGGK